MRLLSDRPSTLTSIAYRQARPGGGSESAVLPVQRIIADGLPSGCRAVLVAGDLQGVAPSPFGGDPVLLGLTLADHLGLWAGQGLVPPPAEVGVVLAGDLYAAPGADRRGASGEVADVWLAFAAAGCAFVIGVAGNHDVIDAGRLAALGPSMTSPGTVRSPGTGRPAVPRAAEASPESRGGRPVPLGPTMTLLDGEAVAVGGVTIGGLGGVIGDPARPHRRTREDFLGGLGRLLDDGPPDVMVLHEGPSGGPGRLGDEDVRRRLARRPPPLTVCGHVHWPEPVAALGAGRVLNVDGRAVLLAAV
ncbi:metallophosphoesterase [Catenuloplanes sp. NPDC051500]|uniref:metallophosphoesterase n=1 Tax=Catenuloplanes sp. NPDC051500 TaxID=3363959 RepID=UPI0037BABDF8